MILRRNIYRGVYHQRENGIGSILSGLFRLLTPFIKGGAKAALRSAPIRSALRMAKMSAIKTAATAATDLISGKNPKQNGKINLKEAQAKIECALSTPSAVNRPKKIKKTVKRVVTAQGTISAKRARPLI